MKKLLLLVIASVSLLSSCGKNEDTILEITPESLQFDAEGGYQIINVISNIDYWSAGNGSWFYLGDDINVGYATGSGNGSIKVVVQPNNSATSRSENLEVRDQNNQIFKKYVTIYQAAGAGNNGGGNKPALSAPTNVISKKDPDSSDAIFISWSTVPGAYSYNIYHSTTSINDGYHKLFNIVGQTHCYHVNPTKGYNWFKVTAVSGATESDFSHPTTHNWIPSNGGNGGGTTKPSAPKGVSATQNGTSVRITWNSVSGATGYKVFYSASANGPYTQFTNSTSNTNWTDPAPYKGANYYKIKAINSAGESDFSSYAYCSYNSNSGGGSTTQKLSAPTGLQAYSGGGFVQISFNPVSLANSYELYRATSATGSYSKTTASGGPSGNKYVLTDSNPRTGTTYYKVKAIPLSSMTNFTASDLSNYVSVKR